MRKWLVLLLVSGVAFGQAEPNRYVPQPPRQGQAPIVIPPAGNAITYGPNGEVYQTFRSPGSAITYGPKGETWQTFESRGSSVTFGSDGSVYQTYGD